MAKSVDSTKEEDAKALLEAQFLELQVSLLLQCVVLMYSKIIYWHLSISVSDSMTVIIVTVIVRSSGSGSVGYNE